MAQYYDMTPEMEQVATEQAAWLSSPLVDLAVYNAQTFSRHEVATLTYAVLAMSITKMLYTEDKLMNGQPNANATKEFLKKLAELVNAERRRIHAQAEGVLN